MITLFFYNFIILSSTYFVWLSEKGKGTYERHFFLCIAFLIVFLPSALRYDIGTDYINYLEIYNEKLFVGAKNEEYAFYLINSFLYNLDAHFQWMFSIFSFIFIYVAFKSYPKKNAWLLHFLFFSILYFTSFNIIRQTAALSICMLAVFVFFEKRYIYFFVLSIIASTFHKSALFIMIVGLLSLIPLGSYVKTRILPYIFLCILLLILFFKEYAYLFIEVIINLFGFVKYINYFNDEINYASRISGTGLGIYINIIFAIYLILNTRQFILVNKNYWLLIIMTFFYAIGLILSRDIVIFERMTTTFIIAPIIGYFLIIKLQKYRNIHCIFLIIYILITFVSFNKGGMDTETSYSDPKRNPYKTILVE